MMLSFVLPRLRLPGILYGTLVLLAVGVQAQTLAVPAAGGAAVAPASFPALAPTPAVPAANLSAIGNVARPTGVPGALPANPAIEGAQNPAPKSDSTTEALRQALQTQPDAVKDNAASEQTEFQRFVAQNTGRQLPLFGQALFRQPEKYAPVLAAPVPPSYVLGPGDELVLQTYGLVDLAERLVIDRNGRVSIPKVGQVALAGVPFGEAEQVLNAQIGRVFTNYTLSLSMGRLRSIEVFVLGQAAQPGKHVVSGLSTLINALFETGGANVNGSLRQIELRRGGRTITSVDLYKFLAQGDASADARLQSGDVIFIPPAGQRAAVLGTVNASAVYELRAGETIADILAFSGGLPVLAAPQKAQLERLDPRQAVARYVEDFALDPAGLQRQLKDGDVLTVFQVSPQIANVVTLEGNVAAPMRYSFRPGMRVADILGDPRLLIPTSYWLGVNRGANSSLPNRPEVNRDYATIQRLDPVGLSTRLLAFNPSKAMGGDARENLELQSGDILTVYRADQAGPPTEDSIALEGKVVGGLQRFAWRPGMTLKDLIPSAQWLIDYYQYWQKGIGQSLGNRTEVQRDDAQRLRNDINWDYARITRRIPQTLMTESIEFSLGQQVLLDVRDPRYKPLVLQPGDQISLFTSAQVQMPMDKRIQFVTVRGEVAVPGVYQLRSGETLPQLVDRAGGITRNAYLYGTVFARESTRLQQQGNIDAAVRRLEAQLISQASTVAQNQADSAAGSNLQAQLQAQQQQLERLRSLKASGRIALDLQHGKALLPAVTLEDGDVITVPTQPNFVGVYGAVLAETSFIHKGGMTVADYIDRAGPTREADLQAALLIRADGTVVANRAYHSWLGFGNSSFMGTAVHAGDSIFVPEVLDRRTPYTLFMQGAKDWTQLLYQFGIGAAAFRTLRN